MTSNYKSSLKFYDEIRDEFLAGKSVRQIGLERSMEPMDVLEFLRWLSREYDVERSIRTDKLLSKMMESATALMERVRLLVGDNDRELDLNILNALRLQAEHILAQHTRLSKENMEYIEHRRKLNKRGGRPANPRAARDVDGDEDDVPEPGGGLEAEILDRKGGRK